MRRQILSQFQKEVLEFLNREYHRKKRTCPCGCGTTFVPSSTAHFFYKRSCYSRYHRMPGMVRRLLKGGID